MVMLSQGPEQQNIATGLIIHIKCYVDTVCPVPHAMYSCLHITYISRWHSEPVQNVCGSLVDERLRLGLAVDIQSAVVHLPQPRTMSIRTKKGMYVYRTMSMIAKVMSLIATPCSAPWISESIINCAMNVV